MIYPRECNNSPPIGFKLVLKPSSNLAIKPKRERFAQSRPFNTKGCNRPQAAASHGNETAQSEMLHQNSVLIFILDIVQQFAQFQYLLFLEIRIVADIVAKEVYVFDFRILVPFPLLDNTLHVWLAHLIAAT